MSEGLAELDDGAFRRLFRDWLGKHCPAEWRRPAERLIGAPAVAWMRRLTEGGFRAPGWPKEYGGAGLSFAKQLICHEELDRIGVSRWVDHGVTVLGPILMRYGTAEQKAYWLPRILSCDDVWAQGYSEPNAGSDLASLRTRAVPDGAHWVINGQKIWTSGAAHATHIFLLTRTRDTGIRQQGISFILADLATPGVTIRPIRNLADEREFCEVFLQDVRVPLGNLVGAVDEGWTVAKALLGMERLAISSPSLSRHSLRALRALGEAMGLAGDGGFDARVAALELDLATLSCLYTEVAALMGSGADASVDLSILKIVSSELWQRITEATMEIAGEHGVADSFSHAGETFDLTKLFMIARPSTIYGGSSEIQRNILAKQLLRPARG
jgi:alkylation response protein AidB-like acyl-CoA dehydrogenase